MSDIKLFRYHPQGAAELAAGVSALVERRHQES